MNTATAPAPRTARAVERHHSAQQAYAIHAANIDALIFRLVELKRDHAQLAVKQPANWGFAGDLVGLEEVLRQAIERIDPQWQGT